VGSQDKRSGRPPLLKDRQHILFVGWAVECWLKTGGITLRAATTHVFSKFGVSLSEDTIARHLKAAGFSAHKDCKRQVKYRIDNRGLVNKAVNFVRKLYNAGTFDGPGKVWSIDCTYTSGVYAGIVAWAPMGR
jgi:hypothetical protein